MSVKSCRGALARSFRDLQMVWSQTESAWRDVKAREFKERYIAPLPDALNSASSIIEELDIVLNKIRRDCE